MARRSNPILDILQTVATIKDTNITKAKMPADKDIIVCFFRVWAYAGFAKGGQYLWGSGRVSCCEGFGCILTVNFFKWCILKHIFIFFLHKKILKNTILPQKILEIFTCCTKIMIL